MKYAQDKPPGEARTNKSPDAAMFRLIQATVGMMRAKADLERRYTGFIRLWGEGLIQDDATETGPEAVKG